MSELMKNKYEVLKIIRENVLLGLHSFGQPVGGENGWNCVESDQPSIQSMGNVVTLKFNSMNRVGFQGTHYERLEDNPQEFRRIEKWIEEQEWEVKVLISRKTAKVTAETMTAEDVAYMLAAWFNGLGVDEFRKHNCGNLYVQMKNVRVYQDRSDVPQNAASFPLKLQVPKVAEFRPGSAEPKCEGIVGVEGPS